ncbi:hypothetical protein HNP77_002267 [Treponema rectale]|uniref:Uncharacterized protein n=1 Tax=Treponema rectale TaxID=744512 RepID=A0A840SIA1_9SPIR|nr:hypothetical protein [Treponema rectale]MBB5219878.1 hypothetical protein [Treponema rectale]
MYFIIFLIFIVYYCPIVLILAGILVLFFVCYKLFNNNHSSTGRCVKKHPAKNNNPSCYVPGKIIVDDFDEFDDFDDFYEFCNSTVCENARRDLKSAGESHISETPESSDSGSFLYGGLPYGDGEIFFESDEAADAFL